jgi:peptidylprolyl isomerase
MKRTINALILSSLVSTAIFFAQTGAQQPPAAAKKTSATASKTGATTASKTTAAKSTTVHKTTPAAQWITTASGLKYRDVVVGKGAQPKTGDTVVVNYTGTFTSGKVFDTSVGKPPFQFVLGKGQVIKGWDEGVGSMNVGGKRKLTIPPDLAYGAQGYPGAIPPNSTLNFDVELLKIK